MWRSSGEQCASNPSSFPVFPPVNAFSNLVVFFAFPRPVVSPATPVLPLCLSTHTQGATPFGRLSMRALLAVCVVAAVCAVTARAGSLALEDAARPLPSSVADWTEADVELWLNRTVGYPEYVAVARAHLVDGPTLLYVDVVEAFQPSHPIHAAKLRAHLDILKRRCVCPQSINDVWSYADEHRGYVLRMAPTAIYLPRFALLYTGLFDGPTMRQLMQPPVTVEEELLGVRVAAAPSASDGGEGEGDDAITVSANSVPLAWSSFLLYWAATLLFPGFLICYRLSAVWAANWLVLTPVMLHFCIQQLNDYLLILGTFLAIRNGKARLMDLAGSWFGFSQLVPPLAWVLGFVLPWALGQVFLWAVAAHCVVNVVAGVLSLLSGMLEGLAEGKKDAEQEGGDKKTA